MSTLVRVRRFFTPRWVFLHVVVLVLVVTFLGLGWWQWQRAGDGNMRSFAYAFEWPVFAIFVLYIWVKEIRDELTGKGSFVTPRQSSRGGAVAAAPTPYGTGALRQPTQRLRTKEEIESVIQEQEEQDPRLAAYNRYLAELNANARRYERQGS